MRLFFVFSLVFAMLFQSFSKLIYLAGYELNKDYIAKVYCENKNKPSMHCDGKCHLAKQMKDEEKRESTPLSNSKDKSGVQFCSELDVFVAPVVSFNDQVTFHYLPAESTASLRSVFHPPSVTA